MARNAHRPEAGGGRMTAWLDWQSDMPAWVTTGVAVVGIGHAMFAFVRTRRIVRLQSAAALLALRTVVLIVVAATAWRPSLVSTSTGDVTEPVTLLVDNTPSMAAVDADRPPGEALRVAVELGELSPSVRDRPTGRLLAAVGALRPMFQALGDAQRQRDLSANPSNDDAVIRNTVAAILKQIDVLKDKAADDATTQFAVERLGAVAMSMNPQWPPPQDLLNTLMNDLQRRENAADGVLARQNAECKAAAERVMGRSRFDLARRAADKLAKQLQPAGGSRIIAFDGSALENATLPEANHSPITLARALHQVSTGSTSSDATVLISDGRSNDNREIIPPTLSGMAAPINTLSVSAGGPSAMLRVEKIDVPDGALLHETVDVRCHINYRGNPERNIIVALTDGHATQQRAMRINQGSFEVRFAWDAASAPLLHLTCHTTYADTGRVASGRTTSELRVADRKIHVLLLAGTDTPDARAWRAMLSATPWIDCVTPSAASVTADQINAADVVVYGDLPIDALTSASAELVRRLIEEQGKSLVLIPSATGQPMQLPAALRRFAAFRGPVTSATTQTKGIATSQPVSAIAVPVYDARDAGVISRDESFDAVTRQWLVRPWLVRPPEVGPLKFGARPLVVDRDTRAPILIESAASSGRVMTLLSSDLWRWGADQTAFVRTIVRSLDDPPFSMAGDGLSIDIDPDPLAIGDNRLIRIKASRPSDGPPSLNVMRDGYVDDTLSPREWPPNSGRYFANFSSDTAGDIVLTCRQGEREVSAPLTIAEPETDAEDTTPDPGLLRRVADVTGGSAFTLDRLNELPDVLNAQRAARVETKVIAIWCSGYVLIFIIACLGCEWALRKQAGLI